MFNEYLQLLEKYSNLNTLHDTSRLTIIVNEECVSEIQKQIQCNYITQGHELETAKRWSQVGIVYSDQYIHVLRDAVVFSDHRKGTYKRVLLNDSLAGKYPVAVLATTLERQAVLVKIWRHATQSWHIELPRGLSEFGENGSQAAERELFEETGCHASSITHLGKIYPDSGLLNYTVDLYHVIVDSVVHVERDASECIDKVIFINIEQLRQCCKNGTIEIEENDTTCTYPLTDPFLLNALYLLN